MTSSMGTADIEATLGYFRELGTLVDQRWSARGLRPDSLPDIAAAALEEVPVPPQVNSQSVLSALSAGTGLPAQRASSTQFGQPPAVMYRREELEVQALTWMEGTTTIHQHGFDGAFRVLQGSSLHVEYSFDQSEALAHGHLVVGALEVGEPEILPTGAVRSIPAGRDFIHALFHLERPSTTIVVRNQWSNLPFPQYDYRLPGLGIDALFPDDRLAMRLRGLDSLRRLDVGPALDVALDICRSQDLWTSFRVCDYWARTYGGGSDLSALVAEIGRRDSTLGRLMEPVYDEELRRGRLLARRSMLSAAHHRLFLALMVNLPDRRSIHSAVSQAFPGEDPDTLILRWVTELAAPANRGVSGLVLKPEDLEIVRKRLVDGGTDDALGVLASQWQPPPLLEKLFG
jgi:hypothetical protein